MTSPAFLMLAAVFFASLNAAAVHLWPPQMAAVQEPRQDLVQAAQRVCQTQFAVIPGRADRERRVRECVSEVLNQLDERD